MKAHGFKDNLETWKLRVRLMVRRGQWYKAWQSVMRTLETRGWKEQLGIPSEYGDGMPLAIWMEFISTTKRGAFSKWPKFEERRSSEDDAPIEEKEERRCKSEQSENEEQRVLNARRLTLLTKHMPSLTPEERMKIPARAAYLIVWMMVRAGDFEDARRMTLEYIAALPPKLDPKAIRASRDIIHLHIPWAFTDRSPLDQHYRIRNIVDRFFTIRPDIRPNARTLFLLLRSLGGAQCPGTLARQVTNAFCRKWGYHVESQRVRQRITTFALIERNTDLAEIELRKEIQNRFQQSTYGAPAKVLVGMGRMGYTRLLRQPMRKIYTQRGVDLQRWKYLARKVRRMKMAAEKRKGKSVLSLDPFLKI
jgi:hypothetical protein